MADCVFSIQPVLVPMGDFAKSSYFVFKIKYTKIY